MFRTLRWVLIPCAVAAIFAAPQSDQSDNSDKKLEPQAQPWKEKPSADWTENEAKQILTKSPWAMEAKAEFAPRQSSGSRIGMGGGGGMGYPGGGMGGGRRGGGGIGFPGGGIGFPGGGIGYPGGGGGYPGGGGRNGGGQYPQGGGQYPQGGGQGRAGNGRTRPGSPDADAPAPLIVRWESAKPIQEAEEKAHDAGAPAMGKPDPNMYEIAIYGFEQRVTNSDSKTLKKQAMLQVDGLKDIKPAKVQVVHREEGPVVIYWFPRQKKISIDDYAVTFDAQLGQMRVIQTFLLEKMVYNNKLEM